MYSLSSHSTEGHEEKISEYYSGYDSPSQPTSIKVGADTVHVYFLPPVFA